MNTTSMFDKLDMMSDEDRLLSTATIRSDSDYEIVDYYLDRMMNGAFDKDTIYQYIYYALVEMKNLSPSLLVPVVIVNLIVNRMMTVEEIEVEISSWESQAHPRDVKFYRSLLGFLFGDMGASDLIEFMGGETRYIKAFMDCSSLVSYDKIRECASAFVKRYGCEEVFDEVYVSQRQSPGWRLLPEKVLFEVCDKPVDKYNTKLIHHHGALSRLEDMIQD